MYCNRCGIRMEHGTGIPAGRQMLCGSCANQAWASKQAKVRGKRSPTANRIRPGGAPADAPESPGECPQADGVAAGLWAWARRIQKLGKVLLFCILLAGLFSAIHKALCFDLAGAAGFRWLVFLSGLLSCGISAAIEYIAYHLLALLLMALAEITQNTRKTARMAEYHTQRKPRE